MKKQFFTLVLVIFAASSEQVFSQYTAGKTDSFTRQQHLRGSVTPERAWWDLLHYDLNFQFFPDRKFITGSNKITFKTIKKAKKMQLDLQEPLAITKITHHGKALKFEREGNVYWVYFSKSPIKGKEDSVEVFWEGAPTESENPPWSGGIQWSKDDEGEDWIASTAQGIGASIFWANKDIGYDEPDRGANISITCPERLTAVSNGRLKGIETNTAEKTRTFHWQVLNPINNYSINVNIGNYVHFGEKYQGLGGELDIDYWVLKQHKEKAVEQFKEVPRTIKAFEDWFGKYPFYEDSFKLVEVPYLGMEHQSSVTYGNGYQNGYRGRDLSHTGIGLKWDFIIVHESGHEWFGNNISMKDAADMWVHEGFTNYSENLFTEYYWGKEDGAKYVIGTRKNIRNDVPIIGTYGVNNSGSSDMYYKGGNMLHLIRQVINDDEKWRGILRGLNKDFWHQTVTTKQIEDYISKKAGFDFGKVFDQYLRTTKIPKFTYSKNGNTLKYRFTDVVPGFAIPIRVKVNGVSHTFNVSEKEQTFVNGKVIGSVEVDENYYVLTKQDN